MLDRPMRKGWKQRQGKLDEVVGVLPHRLVL
jgi:hypothetical protein